MSGPYARQGYTPLCHCLTFNQYDVARLLLAQERLDPNLGPTDEFPLLCAVILNLQDIVELLLYLKQLDANKQTSDGTTPILEAIDVGNPEVIKMLAKTGANPDIETSQGRTARRQALAAGVRVKWRTQPV
ncbi:hypothetical protein N7457_004378 [Penicillium paradoxum]|uniref:uncharacterized protein n=1 Tax=Penicillium paradoxum TaxID=176176 RepID=UPI0025487C3D|nr:uncharacterized protein N7457_004378 [Penicillium paradoxum]KAJ5782604.1 hypothetical protein N7457_004378 [Penicillium paradoxum]